MGALLIDIGNTVSKIALYQQGDYRLVWRSQKLSINDINVLENEYSIERVALSSVGGVDLEVLEYLRSKYQARFLDFNWQTPIPIQNNYRSPQTLGADRLLAAVAASAKFAHCNILVIDCGSAITIDLLTLDNGFEGGSISAGVPLRLKALNQLTHNLPLVELSQLSNHIGRTTQEAIEIGVLKGILYEIEGYIRHYVECFPDLKIVFTGGDAQLFTEHLTTEHYYSELLVFEGLKIIMDYNADEKI